LIDCNYSSHIRSLLPENCSGQEKGGLVPDLAILNAAEPGSTFDGAVRSLADITKCTTQLFNLAELDIRFCTGCWSCWWKTPGICMFRDDMIEILKSIVSSDLVLFATPVFLGMPSALMKRALDRTVPLVHPYIEIHYGESHHRKRYAHYPDLALYADSDGDADEFESIDRWIRRYARNFHGQVRFSVDETMPAKEVADALGGV
jgi:hypothetical protein